MITTVRFHSSSAAPLALPDPHRRLYTIGTAADCDLVIPADLAIDVAPIHGIAERTEAGLIIRDHGARHGLYRWPRSPRVAELHLHPGAAGLVGGCPVLALDPALVTLRHQLAWSIGLDADAAVDDAVIAVASGAPLAIIGAANLDALPLAHAIHQATGAGDIIDIDRERRLSAARVAELLAPRRAGRAIFLASRPSILRDRLDTYADLVRSICLVPLAKRGPEIGRLLRQVWACELGCARPVDTLDPRWSRALAAYRWPRNLDELRMAAPRVLAYAEHRSLRGAASALGITHQTLAAYFDRIGFATIDRDERADIANRTAPRSERSTSL